MQASVVLFPAPDAPNNPHGFAGTNRDPAVDSKARALLDDVRVKHVVCSAVAREDAQATAAEAR